MKRTLRQRSLEITGLILAYALLAAGMTWPLLPRLTEGFVGVPGYGDAFDFVWILWWVKERLSALGNPYFTPLLYHPEGLDLSFQTLSFANALPGVFLQRFLSPEATLNLLYYLSFVVAGVGAHLLARRFVADRVAAFVAGVIYAFAPYHFAHGLGHLNLAAIEWVPFYVLFLHRVLSGDSWKDAVAAGIFFAASALSSWYYGLYMVLWTLFVLPFHLWGVGWRRGRAALLRLSVVAFTGGVLLLPFVSPLLSEVGSGASYMVRGGGERCMADLLGYFTPSLLHPLLGRVTLPLTQRFVGNPSEFTVFLGWVPLLLAIVGLLARRPWSGMWGMGALLFGILSLGPHLFVGGHSTGIVLPFAFLSRLPFFDFARCASRFALLVSLSTAILAAFGVARLRRRFGRGGLRASIVSGGIVVVILLEFLSIPVPMIDYRPAPFYERLGASTAPVAILELPFDAQRYNSIYLYHQTIHHKPILNGFTGRIPRRAFRFISGSPLLSYLVTPTEIPPPFSPEVERRRLVEHDVHFIVVTEPWLYESLRRYHGPRGEEIARTLLRTLDETFARYEVAPGLLVYRVEAPPGGGDAGGSLPGGKEG